MNLERALTIPGFTSEAKLLWLARQACQRQVVVEIGSWMGRSTRALADNCPGVVYAVDDWRGPEKYAAPHAQFAAAFEQFRTHLADHIASGRVQPIYESSPAAADVVREKLAGRGIDLLFIDGDHSLEAVRADLDAWIPLLAPGAMLCGDDFSDAWPGVMGAVRERLQTFAVVPSTDLWYTPRPRPRVLPRRSIIEKRCLYLATPAYGGKVDVDYTVSLADTAAFSVRHALPPLLLKLVPNDSHIDRARNGLEADFWHSPASHLVFVDADLSWRPTDLYRLVACPLGHDVVCGIYPKKSEPTEWPMNWLPDGLDKLHICPACGALEIKAGPTGFMAIARGTLERLVAAHPELACGLHRNLQGHAFFDAKIIEGEFRGEDFGFCDLVRANGGSIWMLPDIPFCHGGKHGCLDVWLREEQPVQTAEPEKEKQCAD